MDLQNSKFCWTVSWEISSNQRVMEYGTITCQHGTRGVVTNGPKDVLNSQNKMSTYLPLRIHEK